MLYGCFRMNGGTLAVVSGRLKADDYTGLLKCELLPFGPEIGGDN